MRDCQAEEILNPANANRPPSGGMPDQHKFTTFMSDNRIMENEDNVQPAAENQSSLTEKDYPETINQDSMEVHHHPDLKHEKKNWKEYFLEFLMIFIAVTLGFFAENLREHIAEKKVEKEYIESFAEDIKTDAAKLNQIIPAETIAISNIDTLYQLLTDSAHSNIEMNRIYYLFRKYTMKFDPIAFNQRTFSQLKNAGGLRLIRNKAASDSIVSYNKSIDDINSTISYTTHNFMLPALYLGNKIFNLKYLAPYSPDSIEQIMASPIKTTLLTKDNSLLAEYANLLYEVKGIRTTYLNQLIFQKNKAELISQFLKKEYKLAD